ncbi:MAG: GNAT family N-acetyltransferase [Gammaproteobacteria bacterium]|nr:GNAT family N-acetyltransferase [Gammaproteobacteria bacterium]
MTHSEPVAMRHGPLRVVTTYLEMKQPPARSPAKPPIAGLSIRRAERPTVSFYRYLYNSVGAPWLWYERQAMADNGLRVIIQHPDVEVYVLYVEEVAAGYVELDRRIEGQIEVAYFGLMPEFIGRGLGPYLLDWAVTTAWHKKPNRVWVHTCNLDHSKARSVYERIGFVSYKQETTLIDDPRLGSNG